MTRYGVEAGPMDGYTVHGGRFKVWLGAELERWATAERSATGSARTKGDHHVCRT